MTTTIFPRCPHCRETMSPMDHGRCTHCGKLCGCSFAPESMSDYCDSHRPAPRREDAAGARERLEQLLYEHVRDRDEEAVELRIAFGIVPDMRDLKTQLLERAAALSTAERERDELHQQLGSAIDVARETMTEITTGRLASIGGIENTYCPQISVSRVKNLHERLVALADSYRARVPSGGEEGR